MAKGNKGNGIAGEDRAMRGASNSVPATYGVRARAMAMKILCWIGIHKWKYFKGNFRQYRECVRCGDMQKIDVVVGIHNQHMDWVDF